VCGGYRLEADADTLADLFAIGERQAELPWEAELFPGMKGPVILERRTEGRTDRHLGLLEWGLIPSWAKDPDIGKKMFNARIEGLSDKPSFREAFDRRRCLIPVDAFFEWSGRRQGRKRHGFCDDGGSTLALAGLWEMWRGTEGERRGTYTVITTVANPSVTPIHHRMPLLAGPEHRSAWLRPGPIDMDLALDMVRTTAQQTLAVEAD
jgi:putative SOS response-associated peptidase YedK